MYVFIYISKKTAFKRRQKHIRYIIVKTDQHICADKLIHIQPYRLNALCNARIHVFASLILCTKLYLLIVDDSQYMLLFFKIVLYYLIVCHVVSARELLL